MNKFTKYAIGAAAVLFAGAQGAQATPVMTMELSSAGATAGQCAAGAIVADTSAFSGSTCTMTSTAGGIAFLGGFGGFNLQQNLGVGNGIGGLSQPQPALWLDNNSSSSIVGSTLVVGLGVTGYTSPVSPFNLLATLSGTNANGMTQTITAWYDAADTGVIGAGSLVLSETFTNFSSISGDFLTPAIYSGSYGLSWILTVTRNATVAGGTNATTGFNGTFTQVPGPAGLALLGFGLIAVGSLRRRKAA